MDAQDSRTFEEVGAAVQTVWPKARLCTAMATDDSGAEGPVYWVEGTPFRPRIKFGSRKQAWLDIEKRIPSATRLSPQPYPAESDGFEEWWRPQVEECEQEPTQEEEGFARAAWQASRQSLPKQATNCAVCGLHKPTPVRNDSLGGYVCAGCLEEAYEAAEAKLSSLLAQKPEAAEKGQGK